MSEPQTDEKAQGTASENEGFITRVKRLLGWG